MAESIFYHIENIADNYQCWLKSHKHETLKRALEWSRDDLLSEKNLQTLFNGPAHEAPEDKEKLPEV